MSTAEAGAPPIHLWRTIWKLLRLRWMIFYIGFKRARRVRKLVILFGSGIFLSILGFVFFLSWMLLRFLGMPEVIEMIGEADTIVKTLPNVLIAGAFLGILVTSFGVLLQALYLAGDMDFLLCRPVPIRAVFITKMLQAVLPNFALISMFALPVMYGLGASQGYTWLYYPLVLIELVVLALAAAGISSLLVMAVVRIFPARRVAEILGFLGATISILCSQSGQIANWNRFTPGNASQALTALQRFNSPWSPLTWAGRGLVELGSGNWLSGIFLILITFGLAAGVFSISLVTAEGLYYTGWANMQARGQKKKTSRREKKFVAIPTIPFIERLIPLRMRAIAIKDWTVLRRDIRNMSQLVTPLIVGIVYAVMFLRSGGQPPAGQGEAPEWFMGLLENVFLYANVGLSLFVGWMLLGRLAGMAFSQEGKNYWLLKSAPIQPMELIAAKYLVAYLPVLGLGWVFLVVIMLLQGAGLGVLLFSLLVVAFSIAGSAGINLAFGIVGAKLDWEDPRQMQRGSTSCLGALVSMIYLPIDLILFFAPTLAARALNLPEAAGQLAGLLFGGGFSVVCGIAPLWLVRGRIIQLGET